MSAIQQDEWVSEAKFWDFVGRNEGRYEYFNGRIYPIGGGSHAMAGGNYNHARLITRLSYFLVGGLDGKPGTTLGSESYVKVEATGLTTSLDSVVHCEEPRFEGQPPRALLNPIVIFEVLSPSTERYDRSEKFAHYRQIPSLRDYIMISTHHVGVEYYTRHLDGWFLQTLSRLEDTLVLLSINWSLSLGDLYRGLNIPVQLTLLRIEDES